MDIENASIEQLQAAIAQKKRERKDIGKLVANVNETIGSPVGAWLITTEGDCEGRTTHQVAVETGHILDLARKWGRKACYGLWFKRYDKTPEDLKPAKEVHIQLDIDSKTWDLDGKTRAEVIAAWAKQEAPEYRGLIPVTESNYYASVKVDFA